MNFDNKINDALGLNKKKSKNQSNQFTNLSMSNVFGKNPFSDLVGKVSNKPTKKLLGASPKMQTKWKHMNSTQRNNARNKYKDTDGDRIPNRFDCSPSNIMRQDTQQYLDYLENKDIHILDDMPKKEKKILVDLFKKNPELIQRAKGTIISSKKTIGHTGDEIAFFSTMKVNNQKYPIIVLSSSKAISPQKRMNKTPSQILRHEIKHKQQYEEGRAGTRIQEKILDKELDEKGKMIMNMNISDIEKRKLLKNAYDEYIKKYRNLSYEKEAIQAETEITERQKSQQLRQQF